jgi:hypothetical protein
MLNPGVDRYGSVTRGGTLVRNEATHASVRRLPVAGAERAVQLSVDCQAAACRNVPDLWPHDDGAERRASSHPCADADAAMTLPDRPTLSTCALHDLR